MGVRIEGLPLCLKEKMFKEVISNLRLFNEIFKFESIFIDYFILFFFLEI